jgi:hypothetical protein
MSNNDYLLDVDPGARHSPVGGSVMDRVLLCPGSVLACHGLPNKSSKFADEGSFAHAFAEYWLRHRYQIPEGGCGGSSAFKGDPTVLAGWETPQWPGYTVTEDMVAEVRKYILYIDTILNANPGAEIAVEVALDYNHLIRSGSGTVDCVIICDTILHVVDLKYGAGLVIHATENKQLLTYATSVNEIFGSLYDYMEIEVHIGQPRRDHFDSWRFERPRAEQFATALKTIGQLIVRPNPPFNPGEKQCYFCPASGNCKAQLEKFQKEVSEEFSNISDPADLPLNAFLHILGDIPLWTGLFSKWQARLEQALLAGEDIPGWKLVRGRRGNRQWALEDTVVVETLTDELAIDKTELFEPAKLKSPSKMEKLLKAIPPDLEKKLITQAEGKVTIAPATDKRPAIKPSDVTEEFSDVSNDAFPE